MRFGEIAALKWRNVDLARKIIRIVETRVYGEEGRTKTAGSKRDLNVSLLPPVIEALKIQREMKLKGQHVFRDQEGALMTPDHIRKVIWTPILEKAGLEYRPPIQARHTFATIAIESGEELGWVQSMLGHKTLQMIFNNYHRWIPNETQRNGSAMMKNMRNACPIFSEAV